MGKIKIKFQPLFFIYVFLCIYFGWNNYIFYYVVTATLHEYGHLITAKLLGYRVDGVVYSLYGVGLKTNNVYKRKDDILVSLAGPLVNLILIIICISLWWIFPTIYFFTYEFVISNIVVMLFNLLPIYPLDGGRVIFAMLLKKFKARKILKVNQILCVIGGFFCIGIFIVTLFYYVNYSFLFIGIFLILNSVINDSNSYFARIETYNKKYIKPIEIKTFKVKDLNRMNLIKYLSPHYYSIFEDLNGKRIEEKDIL